MVLPVRGCIEDVRRLLVEDYFFGRGSRQRDHAKSLYCNDYKGITTWSRTSHQSVCPEVETKRRAKGETVDAVGTLPDTPL